MKKGVSKITACCMASAMVLCNTGVVSMASGFDSPLAGFSAELADSQRQKEEAGVVKVAPTEYDTIAIAQVDEYVNIRDAASTESGNIVGKLYNNCKAEILGKTDDGWYLIQSGGVTGYVSSDYFVTGSQAEALAKEVGTDVATVKEGTETLMVRSSADPNAEVVTMVGDSEKLTVLEDYGDWVKVAVDDDVVGCVSKEYVDCDTEFVEAESVEQVEARKAAIQAAYDRAEEMQQAAYAAMNAADGNEAAYAAQQANAALADAKMLASEQEFDYEAQELADQVAWIAQDTTVASVWAQEAEAEYERIAAEEAAAAAAQAQADAEAAAAAQAAQELADQAAAEAAAQQASADSQQQTAYEMEQEAAAAWQAAVDAQNLADQNWSEEAQAEADAAALAAQEAAAQAEAARQQAEAEAQAAAEAEAQRQQAEAEAQAAAEAEALAQQQAAEQAAQESSGDSGYSEESGSSESGSSESSSSGIRQSVVNYALQFVGNPYVYGGTSLTNGADCSGFVLSVMANFGVSLPRTAADQATVGTSVSLDAIQPGDLLFYQGSGGIGHVSMYIGNGQVVHASNETTGIIISDIGYRTPCAARSFF